jgi:hypothetical protein
MVSNDNIMVYNAGPIAYIGKMVSWEDDMLSMERVLVAVMPRDKSRNVEIGALQFASRDSKVTINIRHMPGMVIENPDRDLREMYERGIIEAYSTLTLAT